MQFPLVLKALQRHKTTVAILLLEFAITFALLSNASILVWQRFAALRTVSGVQEKGLLVATVTATSSGSQESITDKLAVAKAAVEGLATVREASVVSQTPFSGMDSLLGRVSRGPGAAHGAHEISVYFGDQRMYDTLGLSLLSGRWFSQDEYAHPSAMPSAAELHLVVVTRHLAEKLFPGEDPLRKTIYSRDRPMTIVGVLKQMARPAYIGAELTEDAAVFPVVPPPIMPMSLAIRLRSSTTNAEQETGKAVEKLLNETFKGSETWRVSSFSRQREEHFASDRAAFRIMLFLLVGLLGVSINAVAGLSNYWVNQRAHHVATRRALGALRREVIEYFLLENFAICVAGVVVGVALTMSINIWAVVHFDAPRMPILPLVIGFTIVGIAGQLAVAYPAWRMGRVAPAVAARI